MVHKRFACGLEELEIGGQIEIIMTTAFLRSAIILRSFQEAWKDFCRSDSNEKPSENAGVKNLLRL